ncbi:riboflavin synthase [Baekduia soli]|uniref:Riboflavin synthase n=1 Tax=Baekduia soli TaxID=496014 RepID=A0A5B8U6M1_9ACTN|nr:riboflavin synthase [Baekduia soli]QEC48650.1 riboflavin synthase [Baekduia soli]
MFTGLVEDLGTVVGVEAGDGGTVLTVDTALAGQVGEGDSVAVNGVCLTATGVADGRLRFDVMHETLRRSSLAGVAPGSAVNLELALRADGRLGGHIMQGHVDGVGTIAAVREDGFARLVTVCAPAELLRYVVEKGSIAVDGVSLTVARVDDETFDVSLIPETLQRTNLGALTGAAAEHTVNLEVDVVAKYLEKQVSAVMSSQVQDLVERHLRAQPGDRA